jgi:hypothetical protein
MKKILIILLVIALMACGAEQETPTPPVDTTPEPVDTTPDPVPVDTTPEPVDTTPDPVDTTPEPEPEPEYDRFIADLMDKGRTKIKSMQYEYVTDKLMIPGDIYFVRGDKIKVKLQRPLELRDRDNYFDAVFVDVNDNEARAFCMDVWDKNDCLEMYKEFSITAGKYIHDSPIDWLERIPPTAKREGTQQWDKRDTMRGIYDAEEEGYQWVVLMDKTYGVPIYIQRVTGEAESRVEWYEFHSFFVNSVLEEDVTPPNPLS